MNKKYYPLLLGWGFVGFYRGINLYDYNHNKTVIIADKVFTGLYGGVIYANPFLLPLSIYRELYRLEINIRGLEEEKNSKKYYELIFI